MIRSPTPRGRDATNLSFQRSTSGHSHPSRAWTACATAVQARDRPWIRQRCGRTCLNFERFQSCARYGKALRRLESTSGTSWLWRLLFHLESLKIAAWHWELGTLQGWTRARLSSHNWAMVSTCFPCDDGLVKHSSLCVKCLPSDTITLKFYLD